MVGFEVVNELPPGGLPTGGRFFTPPWAAGLTARIGATGSQFVSGAALSTLEGAMQGHRGWALAGDALEGGLMTATLSQTGRLSGTLMEPLAGLCEVSPLAGRVASAAVTSATGYALGGAAGFGYGLATTGSVDSAMQTAGRWANNGGWIGLAQGFLDPKICFVAGTQVVVAVEAEEGEAGEDVLAAINGGVATLRKLRYVTKNIEDIREGDLVVSREQNDANAPLTLSRVDRTYIRRADHLQHVTIRCANGEEQTLHTTDEHPFYVVGKGWTKAQDLAAGNLLQEPDGSTSTVVSSIREERPEGVSVFNLRVEDTHSYFVRAEGSTAEPVWVHNADRAYDSLMEELKAYDAANPIAAETKAMTVGDAGHHVPAVRKSAGRVFEVQRSDLTRPTIHVLGDDVAEAHWRMHDAERPFVGPRQGDFPGTDAELFDAYRRSYKDLSDIRVDVRSPDGSVVLGQNVTLTQAVDLLERHLTGKGGK